MSSLTFCKSARFLNGLATKFAIRVTSKLATKFIVSASAVFLTLTLTACEGNEALQKIGARDKNTGTLGCKLSFHPSDRNPHIYELKADGPAAMGGLIINMYILKIDGKYCAAMSQDELSRALKGTPDTDVTLTIAHNTLGELARDVKLKREASTVSFEPFARLMSGPDDAQLEKEGKIPTPAFISVPGAERRVILQFFTYGIGEPAIAPRYINPTGNFLTASPAEDYPTDIINIDMETAEGKAVAARFGIKKAPAYVFIPEPKPYIEQRQIEREPAANKSARVVDDSGLKALPGIWR